MPEQETGNRRRWQGSRRKLSVRERFARGLINAKRSGALRALVEEWYNAQTEMVGSADTCAALREKVKTIMLGAHRSGELHSIAGEMAEEVRKQADHFLRLKERVSRSLLDMKRAGELERLAQELDSLPGDAGTLPNAPSTGGVPLAPPARVRALKSLLEMKRSGELERIAQEMADAQAKLQVKAAQLQDVANRLRRGLLDAKRSGELERIADEMTQMLDTKEDNIRERLRKALLSAHRAGELAELKGELDELMDQVPMMEEALGENRRSPDFIQPKSSKKWADMTTSSDSDADPRSRGSAWFPPATASPHPTRSLAQSSNFGTGSAPAGLGERRRWAEMATSSGEDTKTPRATGVVFAARQRRDRSCSADSHSDGGTSSDCGRSRSAESYRNQP